MTETHYDVLGISPDATEEEIERAYRQKIKEYHPDRSDDPDAHETFMRVRVAKETLLDPQARQQYDRSHDIQSGDSSDETGIDWALIGIREYVTQLRMAPERGKHWITARLRPQAIGISDVVYSPTVVRLAVTVFLSLVVVGTIRVDNAVSPATEFGVIFVSLCVSYVGYGVLSPLPFEEPRTGARFMPTPVTIWPVLVLHVLGLGLFGATSLTGTPSDGISYAFVAILYVLIVCVACLVVGMPLGALLSKAMSQSSTTGLFGEVRTGLILGLLGGATVLFTSVGKDSTLSAFVETVASNWKTPWIQTLRAGPLHIGSLLNFGLATGMLVCFAIGIVGAWWALTTVPWRDRYEYGYRVHPSPWNLLAIIPFVTVVWMWLRGVTALSLPVGSTTVELLRSDVTAGLIVLPVLCVGMYLLRRHLEPLLQQE